MQDSAFTISVSCRDLLYPASDTVFSYVLWAKPQNPKTPKPQFNSWKIKNWSLISKDEKRSN
jgi:hypothetical protein